MAYDPIPLQGKQYDPMSSYEKAMRLKALGQEAQQREAELQQRAQELQLTKMKLADLSSQMQDKQIMRDASTAAANYAPTTTGTLADMTFGGRTMPGLPVQVQGPQGSDYNNQLIGNLRSMGGGHLVPGIQAQMEADAAAKQKALLEQQKTQSDIAKNNATTSKEQLDTAAKHVELIGSAAQALLGMPDDQAAQMYPQVLGYLQRQGVDVNGVPPSFDRNHVTQIAQMAVTAKDQIAQKAAAQQHADQLAMQKRGQDITLRGQNMVDARSREQNATAREQKVERAKTADNAQLTEFESDMDRLATAAKDLLDHPGLNGITGLRGRVFNIPGGQAAAAEAKLHNLKTQVAFGTLQKMRNASKTGGALGQVSDNEQKMLMNSVAPLDKEQSAEDLKKSLQDIITYANGAKERGRAAFNGKYSGQQPSSNGGGGIKIIRDANGNIIGVE